MIEIYQFNFNSNLDKREDSYGILLKSNTLCEWIWSIFIKYKMCGAPTVTFTMSIVSILLCYITDGHFNLDRAYYPFYFM